MSDYCFIMVEAMLDAGLLAAHEAQWDDAVDLILDRLEHDGYGVVAKGELAMWREVAKSRQDLINQLKSEKAALRSEVARLERLGQI